MTGLFLLLVVGLWIIFLSWLVPKLVGKIPSKAGRILAGIALYPLLLVAPLADEIIGGMQFRSICKASAVLSVDENKVRNQTLIFNGATDEYLRGYFLPIRQQYWSYTNEDTGETVISWNAYHATGGLFIRALGISETNAPLTFNGVCYPGGTWPKIFENLNIAVKDRR